MAISVVQVNEDSAQLLANETGKIVYLRGREGYFGELNEWMRAEMTTDRQEAVAWGEFFAVPPVLTDKQQDADMLGANLRVLAQSAEMTQTFARPDLPKPPKGWGLKGEQTIQGIDAINDEVMKPITQRTLKEFGQMSRDAFADAVSKFEPDPEPQLRVVRVLEYRGPRAWVEEVLRASDLDPENPLRQCHPSGTGEIVEQIRMRTPLCRWCGEDHLDRESEVECQANPRRGKY
jgi:hypothetical protein